MSLATLLVGVGEAGPLAADAPQYKPCIAAPSSSDDSNTPAWRIDVLQSGDRGNASALTEGRSIHREAVSIPVESIWSGLAWRLRSRGTQRPRAGLQRRHLRGRNQAFCDWLRPKLAAAKAAADQDGDPILGVTQLNWSAGAAAAFAEVGIPWLVFVRDELQFQHPGLYRDSLEGAVAVCGAGEGLLRQIEGAFTLRRAAHVPLPVDFRGRFGAASKVASAREAGLAARSASGDIDTPRIAIIGVTPEKGAAFYRRLLPKLAESWPEAHVDIYGGGSYAEALGRFSNTTWHGHTPVEQVFVSCDVHLLTVQSTGSWGRVINEAGLFGIPSVSVDIGSQPEAVGNGGLIVPANADIDAWIGALRSTYEQRVGLGEKARAHAGIVDHRRSIAMFRSVLHECLEG